jgi:hypothetical protein
VSMFEKEVSESDSESESERDGDWDFYPGGCPLETADKFEPDESEFDHGLFLAGVESNVELLLVTDVDSSSGLFELMP